MKSIEKSLMEHLSQKLSDAPEKIEKVDKATRFEKIAAITTSKRLKVVKLSTTLRCTCNRGDVENINYRLK